MEVRVPGEQPGPGMARLRIAPVPTEHPITPGETRPAVLVDVCDSEGRRCTVELDWCTDASLRLDPNAGHELRVRVLATGRDEVRGVPLAIELGADGREAIAAEVRRQIDAVRAEERRAHPLRTATAEDFPPPDAAHFPALHRSLLEAEALVSLAIRSGDTIPRGAAEAAASVIADELSGPVDSAPPLGAPGSVARAAQELGRALRRAGHKVKAIAPPANRRP